jgi:hypothetical protein
VSTSDDWWSLEAALCLEGSTNGGWRLTATSEAMSGQLGHQSSDQIYKEALKKMIVRRWHKAGELRVSTLSYHDCGP